MSYIAPSTIVRLLKGVKLDPTYANTIYFDSEQNQITYFASKQKYVFSNLTYRRYDEGVLTVERSVEDLYDIDYMMFQNSAYGNKWFYAFVTSVDYVSNGVSNIHYEIDRVQTWLFEMELMPCLIERTHVPSNEDVVGANITPEQVFTGEYVHSDQNVALNLHDSIVAIQVVDVDSHTINLGSMFDGVFGGANIWIKRISEQTLIADLLDIATFLDTFRQKPAAVIGMYMLPSWCLGGAYSSIDGDYLTPNAKADSVVIDGLRIYGNESFDGYVPRNKKLYTYPYNFHEFVTSDGQTMKMRYEFCTDLQPKVMATGCIVPPVQIAIRPIDYKGVNREQGIENYVKADYEEHLTVSNFPLCSWAVDSYNTWVAQNQLPRAIALGGTLGGMYAMGSNMRQEAVLSPEGEITQKKIAHFMQLDPNNPKHQKWFSQLPEHEYSASEVLMAGLPNIVTALQTQYEASINADTLRGTLNTGNTDFSAKAMNVYQRRTHISKEYAKMIDNFFDLYGYAVGEIGYVQRNVRRYWTYVKTKNCCIKANCNANDVKFVENLYNRGITWWADGDMIGRYDLADQNVSTN